MVQYRRVFWGFGWLLGGLLLLLAGGAVQDLNAQASIPRKEEEEPAPKKEASVPKAAPAVFRFSTELAGEKHPLIQGFWQRIITPYDHLISDVKGVKPYKIALLPNRKLPDGKLDYFELNADLETGKTRELPTTAGFGYKPFEEIVLEEVEGLLGENSAAKLKDVKRDDLIERAVQALSKVRLWHASWVEQKKRVGNEWAALDRRLARKIIDLRREQLKASADAKNWKRADELAHALGDHIAEPEAKKDLYRFMLRKALALLRTDRDEDYTAVRDALNQYVLVADSLDDDVITSARQLLTARADQLAKQAAQQANLKQHAAALLLLKQAEALAPDLPAVQQLRSSWRDRVLYVGVSRLPELLSPAKARSDAERQGMELLFESLLQSVPDIELGRRYRPVLAAALPSVAPLSREFSLVKNARWTGDNGKGVDARDVFGTLELLRAKPQLPGAEGIDLLDRPQFDDPFRVRLSYRQGLLEPLSLSTFKVLPARHLTALNKAADDDAFARRPFGSGPYRYEGREADSAQREAAVFRANPYYGQRTGKFGSPGIQEIRFVVPKLTDAPTEIAEGRLHLVLDVPTADVSRYADDPKSADLVTAVTPVLNRRIYMLAINHRRLAMQDVDLRRGISAAIDRESILQSVFRPDMTKVHHRPLAGPYPLNCWATPEKARKAESALFNKNLAGGLLIAAGQKQAIKLSLIFSADDPQAARACDRIKEQVESATKKTPDDAPLVEIVPIAVPGERFWWRLEQERDFDLAYLPYDYKDDLYWLGYLLDRAAADAGGRNFLGYLAPGSNSRNDDNDLRIALDEIRAHRDFIGKVREETWKFHAKFLARMPFVPLWQLDRHLIISKNLELHLDSPSDKVAPSQIDPANVFLGVERWRMK